MVLMILEMMVLVMHFCGSDTATTATNDNENDNDNPHELLVRPDIILENDIKQVHLRHFPSYLTSLPRLLQERGRSPGLLRHGEQHPGPGRGGGTQR